MKWTWPRLKCSVRKRMIIVTLKVLLHILSNWTSSNAFTAEGQLNLCSGQWSFHFRKHSYKRCHIEWSYAQSWNVSSMNFFTAYGESFVFCFKFISNRSVLHLTRSSSWFCCFPVLGSIRVRRDAEHIHVLRISMNTATIPNFILCINEILKREEFFFCLSVG